MNNNSKSLQSLPVVCREFDVSPGHEPSLLPGGLDFQMVWNDEFDGMKLDQSKWAYRLCMMQKRHQAWTDYVRVVDAKERNR